MVQLTSTPAFVNGFRKWNELNQHDQDEPTRSPDGVTFPGPVSIGDPISYNVFIALSRELKKAGFDEFTLEKMLHGARVYVPPPPPKPEPTPEFQALMARLRRDEEERSYQRMVNPSVPRSLHSTAQSFAEVHRPHDSDLGDDDVTYGDVHRQLTLILNFLVSIFGVAATLWIVARWWSTPARLFLTLGGSAVVAVAEVAVYSGYVWHLGEAKKKDKKSKDKRQIVRTWVLAPDKDAEQPVPVDGKTDNDDTRIRRRKKDPT